MKLGIYGGSFDPPHLGHLHAAASAAKHLGLDKLLLIPAGIPPHKALSGGLPDAEHRAVMTDYTAQRATLLSGIPTVNIYLDQLGMSCDDKDQKMEIVMKIKEKALAEGRLLTIGEFEDIAHSVLG